MRRRFPEWSEQKRRLIARGILALLVVWGGVLRGYRLGTPSLWIDEAATVLQCRGVLQSGMPILPNSERRWDGFPAVYLQATAAYFTADPHLAVRAPSAAAGTLCILLAYLLTRRVTGARVPALLAAGSVCLLEEQVAWSRQGRPYIFVALFLLTALLMLVLWMERRSTVHWLAALIAGLAASLSHRAGYVAVLAVLVFSLAHARRLKAAHATYALVALAGAAFVAASVTGSNSNAVATLRGLFGAASANYVPHYWRYLLRHYRWLLAATLLAAAPTATGRRFALPLAACALLYFAAIGLRTRLFAHRYIFTLSPVMALLWPLGVWNLRQAFTSAAGCRLRPWAIGAAVVLLTLNGPFVTAPSAAYDLGPTAPTPPWRQAFALVLERERSLHAEAAPINTVTAFPALHDIYLRDVHGEKWFTAINSTGFAGDMWREAPYTDARTLDSVSTLRSINGYAILDDYALRMMADPDIRAFFAHTPPNAILHCRYNVYIWILTGER